MTTITINKRTKAGKLLFEMAKLLSEKEEGVEIVSPKRAYSADFEAKIKKAEEDIKSGKATRINPKSIWESIL
jgi:basic membrane lipoprotein Med (substrate-binding protein (PBP1-ABC) superfamily)